MDTSLTSDELRAQLAAAVGESYRLDEELPAGGMSRLFLATERSLDRRVVIKLLPPEYTSDVAAARFEREMTLTAHLQHPHVVPILAAGSSNGLLYCITPYVAGESLRRRLKSAGALPIAAAVQILREVADALARAHDAGVVHRDIKPENILMQGEHALLADFGVAHVLQPAATGERLTATGMALGTLGYMAPEQLVGDSRIDGRADIYALAIVGYEMLAGHPPFEGKTAQALLGAHLTQVPRPLSEVRPEVPEAVSAAISKALEKDPEHRFATAAEFRDALASAITTTTIVRPLIAARPTRKTLGIVGAAIVAAGAIVTWWIAGPRLELATPAVSIRIAVLPFQNLGDSANAYFADGVADAVRDKLVAIRGFQVIASTSSNQYRNTKKSLRDIANELDVQYVLTGTVQWTRGDKNEASGRVNVHPELIDPATGVSQWSEGFNAPFVDVFNVQTSIAQKVAARLQVSITSESRTTIARRPTVDLDAYDAYLRARALEQTAYSPTTYARLIAAYKEVVRRDSMFALAWAALGRAQMKAYVIESPPPPNVGEDARGSGQHALRIDPSLAGAYVVMAQYYRYVKGDRDSSLATLQKALALAPMDATILSEVGNTEVRAGQWTVGVRHIEQSLKLDPRDVGTAVGLGSDYLRQRRYDEARRTLDRALALEPTNLVAIKSRAMVQLAQGDIAGARDVLRKLDPAVDSASMLAYLTSVDPLPWVLDSAQQRALLALTPESFEGMRSEWARAKALVYANRGDETRARAYFDTSRVDVDRDLAKLPGNAISLAFRSGLLAHLGRKAEAIADGDSAAKVLKLTDDAFLGPWVLHQLAQTYVATGEFDKAIDALDKLLKVPHYLSPAWLRVDPTFAPLRNLPRFQQLVAAKSSG